MRATRRGLLALGVLAALPAAAGAQQRSDAQILEELLGLEGRLESAYDAALRRGALGPELAERLRDQERAHARGLERALSTRGPRTPQGAAPDPGLTRGLRDRRAFGRYALELEHRALRAYVRAAAEVRDPALRQPLGAIMACEAQHEVALRETLGEPLLGGVA